MGLGGSWDLRGARAGRTWEDERASPVNICRKSIPSKGNSRYGGPESAVWGDGFEEEPGSQVVMRREAGVRSALGDVPPPHELGLPPYSSSEQRSSSATLVLNRPPGCCLENPMDRGACCCCCC